MDRYRRTPNSPTFQLPYSCRPGEGYAPATLVEVPSAAGLSSTAARECKDVASLEAIVGQDVARYIEEKSLFGFAKEEDGLMTRSAAP